MGLARRDVLRAALFGGIAVAFGLSTRTDRPRPRALQPTTDPTPAPATPSPSAPPPAAPTPSSKPPAQAPKQAPPTFSGTVVRTAGFEVPAGQTFTFDPNRSTTVEVPGNVVVRGKLVMRPARPDVVHILRFVRVAEARFAGGGNDPIASDVGLWVIGGGVLDLVGRRVGAGVTVDGTPLGAMSRTVRIEGTSTGRAHTFIRLTKPAVQRIDGVMFRFMGVSKPVTLAGEPRKVIVPGRYALHFHHCGDFTRGSVVRNVLIRDGENRAFVPHASHGITFQRCVAYRVVSDAYWWDPPDSQGENASHNILFEDCIAAFVRESPDNPAISTGFTLSVGSGNVARRCVAVRVTGPAQSGGTGFNWPRAGSSEWTVEDCVTHHNQTGGFIWTPLPQTIKVRAYANSYKDWTAGAYNSAALYRNCSFESTTGFHDAGVSAAKQKIIDASRFLGPFVIVDVSVNGLNADPVSVRASQMEGGILVDQPGLNGSEPTNHEFVNCTRAGRGLERSDFTVQAMRPGSIIRVVRRDGSSFQITG